MLWVKGVDMVLLALIVIVFGGEMDADIRDDSVSVASSVCETDALGVCWDKDPDISREVVADAASDSDGVGARV